MVLTLLFLVALLAGFVDSIAGGGGLITIPALLWAGLGPVATLATNKAQAVFGSGTAALNFIHKGEVDLRTLTLIGDYRGRQDSVFGMGFNFGVYARCVTPGTISVGDELTLV